MSKPGRLKQLGRKVVGWAGLVPATDVSAAVSASLRQLSSRTDRIEARFDSAMTTDSNERHWANADGLNADQAANPGVRCRLRNRARYEVANNSYARGMLETYADDMVGTGPVLQMQTKSKQFNRLVERLWLEWSIAVQLARKLRTMVVCKKQDGETFAQLFTNPKLATPAKLDFMLLEGDRIESMFLPEVDNMVDGILFDEYGNPVRYNVARQPINPIYGTTSGQYDEIAAKFMIHWFRVDRPGQHRGLPEIMPALRLFSDLRRYTLAVVEAAETAADFSIILETQASADTETEDIDPLSSIDIERGMMVANPAGWTSKQMKAEQPTQQYSDFKREIVNEIGRCLNMPFNIAAANSAGYNFASGRLDHMIYDRTIDVERADCELVVIERLFAEWAMEGARASGGFRVPAEVSNLPHSWIWTNRKHADPVKEAQATKIELETGMTTYAREYGKRGLDWEDEFEQREREQARTKTEAGNDAGGNE